MTYEETLNYIHSIPKFVRPLGNADLTKLLAVIGNPHQSGRFIHIAGTNGKGSTAAMLSSILTEAGYKTGLYTSPFIEVFNERIRINGENIPDSELCRITETVKAAAENNDLKVSEFAFITAAAFLYFKEQQCDYAVIETGMGGRLDATNVLAKTEVSILTSIGLDHTQYLGATIEEIAREKCGIIKRGGRVVSQQNTAVAPIVQNAAREMGAELVFAGEAQSTDGGFIYKGEKYALSLAGEFQSKNAAAVIESVELLRQSGARIDDAAVKNGLKNTTWAARFEYITDNVIIDGAHNIDGIRALKASLDALKKPYGIVMAMMSDKAVKECVQLICENAEFAVMTEINMPRSAKAAELAMYVKGALCEADYKNAIRASQERVQKNGVVCICGSLYLAGAARTWIRETNG